MSTVDTHLGSIYPLSRAYVPAELWHRIADNVDEPDAIPLALNELKEEVDLPSFIADLAQMEWAIHSVRTSTHEVPQDAAHYQLNPTLELSNLSWKLCELMRETDGQLAYHPDEGDEWAMIWRDPKTSDVRIEAATPEDLLILKIIIEETDAHEIASLGNLTVTNIDQAMRDAAERGILIAPKSKLVRDTADQLERADVFTLQWHIMHDQSQSERSPLTLEQGLHVLDDLRIFCRQRFVRGHVCFAGSDPSSHEYFMELHRAAEDHGFSTSIQAEGLNEHNDENCGAAFNFIAVLPDGEAHACRKFPSSIGNVIHQSIGDVYDSDDAKKYRRGSAACGGCKLRHACGGCLAVAHGSGLNIFEEKDPFCTKR